MTLAMQPRVDVSPDRTSVAKDSVYSAHSRQEAPAGKDASEPELLPERASGQSGQGTEAPLSVLPTPFPLEQIVQQLGTWCRMPSQSRWRRRFIRWMMIHQAKVDSRLEMLEVASRGAARRADPSTELGQHVRRRGE